MRTQWGPHNSPPECMRVTLNRSGKIYQRLYGTVLSSRYGPITFWMDGPTWSGTRRAIPGQDVVELSGFYWSVPKRKRRGRRFEPHWRARFAKLVLPADAPDLEPRMGELEQFALFP